MLHNPCVKSAITIATLCWISSMTIQTGDFHEASFTDLCLREKTRSERLQLLGGGSAGAGPWNPATISVNISLIQSSYKTQLFWINNPQTLMFQYTFNSACLSQIVIPAGLHLFRKGGDWKSLNFKASVQHAFDKSLLWLLTFSSPQINMAAELSTSINIKEPRWDQSTFVGRAKHFFTVTDPRNILLTNEQLDHAHKIITDYR